MKSFSARAPPRLRIKQTISLLKPGGNLTLFCSGIGNPPPKYEWTFNGEALNNENNESLTIVNVSLATIGKYGCNISNDFGYDYAEASVTQKSEWWEIFTADKETTTSSVEFGTEAIENSAESDVSPSNSFLSFAGLVIIAIVGLVVIGIGLSLYKFWTLFRKPGHFY